MNKEAKKKIFVAIAKTFTLSIIIVIFLSSFFLGVISGYVKGRTDSQYEFTAYLNNLILTPSPTSEPTRTPPQVQNSEVDENKSVSWGGVELWETVNNRRKELGVNSLNQKDELCTIAAIRLNELMELGTLDGHVGFSKLSEERDDLKWIFDKYGVTAEFLAVGGDSPEETVALWENTLGHKKLLTGGEYVWGCIYSQNTFAVAIAAY